MLNDSSSPQTTNWAGTPANYEPITFKVPAGQDRLNVSIAYQNALTDFDSGYLNARVRLTLVDPAGNLAGYSVPQGNGNYGNLQITSPKAGTWTGYIWSNTSSNGGSHGSGAVECRGGAVRVVRKRQSEEHDARSGSVEAGDVDRLDAELAR